MYVSVHHVHICQRGQKRVSDLPELELEMLIRQYADARN